MAVSAQRSQSSESLPAQEMWRNWTSLSLDQVGKSCKSDCRVQIGRNLPPTLEEILVGKIGVLGYIPCIPYVWTKPFPNHFPGGTEYLEFNLTEGDFYRVSDGGTYAVPCNPGYDSENVQLDQI